MSRLIVHAGTGTILDASECVVVDADYFDDHDMARLSGDDYFDDDVVVEIAERCGVAIPDAVGAARWNAFMNGPEYVRRRVPFIVCVSCDNVGNETMVNPLDALVVPWDVMGDPRAFAFVCDECASGSAVVL
jgi:hypothetical protein